MTQLTEEEEKRISESERAHEEINAILQKYIGKMYGGLEAASITHFLETGSINGSFRLNLVRMIFETHYQLSKPVEQEKESLLQRIAELEEGKVDLLIIRNTLVNTLPTGEVSAWDFTIAIKKYITWFDDYVDGVIPSGGIDFKKEFEKVAKKYAELHSENKSLLQENEMLKLVLQDLQEIINKSIPLNHNENPET